MLNIYWCMACSAFIKVLQITHTTKILRGYVTGLTLTACNNVRARLLHPPVTTPPLKKCVTGLK